VSLAPTSTWVLLRGLTRESAHWGEGPEDFPATLQRALPEARPVLLDLPGNGRFNALRSPSRVEDMVSACRAEMTRQRVAGPVHLLAMSLGAMVAIEWARQAPQELGACVLINTSVRPFSPPHHRLRPGNLPLLLRRLLGPGSPRDLERTVLQLTSHRDHDADGVLDHFVGIRQQRPVSRVNALRQLLAAARYRAPTQAPPVPVLLLASTRDRLVDSRCSQALARAWGCPLKQHPCAGHDLPLDDPAWVARQVRDWLDSLPRAAGGPGTQVSNF